MQEVLNKLQEHDKNFVQIKQRFDDVDKRFDAVDKRFDAVDKRFDAVDKRFEVVDKRFDRIDGQIDFLAKKFLEHDERLDHIDEKLEQVATKEDISKMTNTLDKVVKLYETKDQEVALIARGLKDVEEKVEEHSRDIKRMKPILGIS